jgi:hypothetical protein
LGRPKPEFFPLTVRAALLDDKDPSLQPGRDLVIPLPSGETAKLIELEPWHLLNLTGDAVLAIPGRLVSEFGLDSKVIAEAIGRHSLQTLGLADFSRRFLSELGPPCVFVPGSKHYSFPKAVALLGLGLESLVNVAVDLDARQDLSDLRRRLDECLAERRPVIAVVAVIGTTEESAVDPLADILALRNEYVARGLFFHVHADAAFGGYHRSLINEPFDLSSAFAAGGAAASGAAQRPYRPAPGGSRPCRFDHSRSPQIRLYSIPSRSSLLSQLGNARPRYLQRAGSVSRRG